MKLLVVALAVALLAWLLFGRSRRRPGRTDGAQRRAAPPGAAAPLEGMVACAHCGVHLPASEALLAYGRSYCSEAHRDAGPPP